MDLAYTISGFVVGFIVGLTGVGGGSLMTPILVLLFGIKPAIAVGTDLLYAAITKCGGIWVHHRQRTINWRIVRIMSAGSLPASALTVWTLKHFHDRGIDYTGLITSTLGIALILTSMVLLYKKQLVDFSLKEQFSALRSIHSRLKTPITFIVGVFLGVLVTLSSVGAGALGAATLFFIYPRLPAVSIVGTDLAHAVPLTAVAGLGHAHLGTVDFVLLGSLLVGSLPGIYLGSHLGIRLPEHIVRPILASMLLIIGARFTFSF
ncbi:MAG: sulfite exporter TauE/SafE family protein [Gammaproteobacteria bacterium]